MDVNKTTIQRYENGSIDNTKKLIVEGLADALHVSAAWLRGETEDMGADMSISLVLLMKRITSRRNMTLLNSCSDSNPMTFGYVGQQGF